jgi:N-acetyl-alpha-D-glucosaminyl L-malate synthase BshA
MKIGITCYPTYGGSGVVATELGKRLAERGNEVHFISYALPYRLNSFSSQIFYHEVDVLQYPLFEYPPYSLSLASKMADVIEFQNLDIMHVHYAIPHATSAYLAKQMMPKKNLKYVTTLHGTDITLLGGDPSFFKITKFSIEESSGITAVSQFLRDKTIEVFQTKNEIEIIPNFVPFDINNLENKPEIRECFAKEDEQIITHISNFRPLKRVTDIVPILKKVTNKFKIKMLMVGDGPERYKMEEQCRQEHLCDSVVFLGKQENIFEILSISDVVLIPSESESFGLVALEALACGVPCVSTNAGGLPEVNKNGITGYTRDVGDINGLAEAVTTILSDRELAKTMGKAGKEIALNNFSAEVIIPKYIKYYEKILNSNM